VQLSEVTVLLRSLGAVHKRAYHNGDRRSVERVEMIARDLLAGNGLPFHSVTLMMASYWPLEVVDDDEAC
jgi:hypothetical protein